MPQETNCDCSIREMVGLPEEELEKKKEEIDKLLAAIGRNFVRIVSSLHDRRYVLGDINEGNIKVGLTGRIAVLDPDSFQIYDHRRRVTYRCPVGRAEFTDPNLMTLFQSRQCNASRCPTGIAEHQMSYGCVDRTIGHDNFAIAIVLFKLLVAGRHPFDMRDDPRPYPEKIMGRQFPYKEPFDKCPTGTGPRWNELNSAWQVYFTNTFTTDRRYQASEVLALFEDDPPFSKPNLGDQIEVDGGFSFSNHSALATNATRQTVRATSNATGNRQIDPHAVTRQPNPRGSRMPQQPTLQPTNRFGKAARGQSTIGQCPRCGKTDPGQFRCSNCKLDLPPLKTCAKPNCGNRMNVAVRFCSQCGSAN